MTHRVWAVLVGGALGAAILWAVLVVCSSCSPEPVVVPPRERPEAGAPADCSKACVQLRALGCDEGLPTPGGASCESVCGAVEQSGATTLDVGCVAAAESCEAARACGYGGPP